MMHSFDVNIAEKYGIEKAVLLYNIALWVEESKAGNKCFYDGYYWGECSNKGFVKLFPYLNLFSRFNVYRAKWSAINWFSCAITTGCGNAALNGVKLVNIGFIFLQVMKKVMYE